MQLAAIIPLAVTIFAVTFSLPSALAQNVNAKLCGGSGAADLKIAVSAAATDELRTYLKGLKSGGYSFNYGMTGSEAAKQLGFRKRFGSTYDELVEITNGLIARNGTVHIDQVIQAFEKIVNDEIYVDSLADQSDWQSSVAYLRSIQNSECAFPYTAKDLPSASDIVAQMKRAYSNFKGDANEQFKKIYDKTVQYARARMQEYGSVSIYQIVAEWRRATRSLALTNRID